MLFTRKMIAKALIVMLYLRVPFDTLVIPTVNMLYGKMSARNIAHFIARVRRARCDTAG